MTSSPQRRSQAGFTLVEVLIALSLLAVLMLLLTGALRSAGQTETRVDQRLQQADELRIQVKLPAARVDAAIAAIWAVHPYEVPEIVVTPILDGNPDYLAWIDAETAPDAHRPPAPSPR